MTLEQLTRTIIGFNNKTLPKEEWTHEAHLIVAIWYTLNYDMSTATELTRKHIKAYNTATGTPNSDTRGYHETLTIFWLDTAHTYVEANKEKSLVELCNGFIASAKGSREYPMKFYSRELLYSVEARHHYVAPDILS